MYEQIKLNDDNFFSKNLEPLNEWTSLNVYKILIIRYSIINYYKYKDNTTIRDKACTLKSDFANICHFIVADYLILYIEMRKYMRLHNFI